jgi:hypothetical protein
MGYAHVIGFMFVVFCPVISSTDLRDCGFIDCLGDVLFSVCFSCCCCEQRRERERVEIVSCIWMESPKEQQIVNQLEIL